MLEVTLGKLTELNACSGGVEWFSCQKETDLGKVCLSLIEDGYLNWANWLIVRYMTKRQRVQYAIVSAEQVIHIFENKYPEDSRPRKAIEAAKAWIGCPSEETRAAAAAAADAAATYATYAANAATYAYAAAYARKELQIKIIEYGLGLIKDDVKPEFKNVAVPSQRAPETNERPYALRCQDEVKP